VKSTSCWAVLRRACIALRADHTSAHATPRHTTPHHTAPRHASSHHTSPHHTSPHCTTLPPPGPPLLPPACMHPPYLPHPAPRAQRAPVGHLCPPMPREWVRAAAGWSQRAGARARACMGGGRPAAAAPTHAHTPQCTAVCLLYGGAARARCGLGPPLCSLRAVRCTSAPPPPFRAEVGRVCWQGQDARRHVRGGGDGGGAGAQRAACVKLQTPPLNAGTASVCRGQQWVCRRGVGVLLGGCAERGSARVVYKSAVA